MEHEEVIKVKARKKTNSLASALNGGSKTIPDMPASSSMKQRRMLFQPFKANIDETQNLRGETSAFGSQPLPIAGGEFAPYLGTGAIYAPEKPTWFPKSFSDWQTWSSPTGDWGGTRSWLNNRGIKPGGRFLMEWEGNVAGGRKHMGDYADEIALSVDIDFQKLLGVHLGTLHYLMTIRNGSSTRINQAIPAIDPPNEIAGGGEGTRLTWLAWEMLWNKYVRTEIGEMNAESDFEQSTTYWGANLYCQFVNNGICGMPQSIAINSGYTWYPSASPGGFIKIYPTGNDHWLISAGLYSENKNASLKSTFWDLGLSEAVGAFVPVQLGWHRGGTSDYSGPLQTNIRVGAYWDSQWTTTADSSAKLGEYAPYAYSPTLIQEYSSNHSIRSPYGAWITADTMFERDGKDPRRGTTILGTFTWGDPRSSPAPYFVTLGVVRKGTFPNRPNDTISLGGKMLWASDSVNKWEESVPQEACQKTGGCWRTGMESALELNYGWRPLDWLLIRPNLQFYFGPAGSNRYNTTTVVGLESGFNF